MVNWFRVLTLVTFVTVLGMATLQSSKPEPDPSAVVLLVHNWERFPVQIWARGNSEWGELGDVAPGEGGVFVLPSVTLAGSDGVTVAAVDTAQHRFKEFEPVKRLPGIVLFQRVEIGELPKLEIHNGQ